MAERNGLLNRRTPKGYPGFESLSLRKSLCEMADIPISIFLELGILFFEILMLRGVA